MTQTTDNPANRYGVILADPPWTYSNFKGAEHGAAESAMDVMSVADIAAIPVGERFAAKDCILMLWGTWPKLPEALEVMNAWGFRYVTGFPWVKTIPSTGNISRGVGFWTMGASEFLFIGRRGKPTRDRGKAQVGLLCGSDNVFYAPRGGRHSEKPLELHLWIERSLKGPYLELFARRRFPGWSCWGSELGYKLTSQGVTKMTQDWSF
jgi:N6-adenosine-specific RNA methylase IME4